MEYMLKYTMHRLIEGRQCLYLFQWPENHEFQASVFDKYFVYMLNVLIHIIITDYSRVLGFFLRSEHTI